MEGERGVFLGEAVGMSSFLSFQMYWVGEYMDFIKATIH